MVRKIYRSTFAQWGVVATTPPSTLPLSNFRANGRSDLKIFFMDRYPKDEHTGKNLVCKKALPISKKNWKKPVGGMAPPPGNRRVKMVLLDERGCHM